MSPRGFDELRTAITRKGYAPLLRATLRRASELYRRVSASDTERLTDGIAQLRRCTRFGQEIGYLYAAQCSTDLLLRFPRRCRGSGCRGDANPSFYRHLR